MSTKLALCAALATLLIISVARIGYADVPKSAKQLIPVLRATTNPNLYSIRQWNALDDDAKTIYLIGVVLGNHIAVALDRGDQYTLKRREVRRYLLDGWTMLPRDYCMQVDAEFHSTPTPSTSIAASIVRSEALFARLAHDDTRATSLATEADQLEREASMTTNKRSLVGGIADKEDYWKLIAKGGASTIYMQGVLDGIALERFAVDNKLASDYLDEFNLPDIQEEMTIFDTRAIPDKCALYLYLSAHISLTAMAAD